MKNVAFLKRKLLVVGNLNGIATRDMSVLQRQYQLNIVADASHVLTEIRQNKIQVVLCENLSYGELLLEAVSRQYTDALTLNIEGSTVTKAVIIDDSVGFLLHCFVEATESEVIINNIDNLFVKYQRILNRRICNNKSETECFTYWQGRNVHLGSLKQLLDKTELNLEARILDHMTEGVCMIRETDAVLVYCNKAFANMLGYQMIELIGMNFNNFLDKEHQFFSFRDFEVHERIKANGEWKGELKEQKKDGTSFWISSNITTFKHPYYGNVFLSINRDISEKKHDDDLLLLQHEILDHMQEGVHLVKMDDSKIVYYNKSFASLSGYNEEELIGKSISIINAPGEASPDEIMLEINSILKKNGKWKGELKSIRKDGQEFWSSASVSEFEHPVYGSVWITIQEDISLRKAAEEKIIMAQALFSNYLDSIAVIAFVKDLDLNYIYINKNYEELVNLNRDELSKRKYSDFDFFDEATAKQFQINDRLALGGLKYNEIEELDIILSESHSNPIHEKKFYLSLKFPLKDGDGNILGLAGFAADITELIKAERELQKTAGRLTLAETIAKTGNWELDVITREFQGSLGAAAVYGISAGSYNLADMQKFTLPEYRESLENHLNTVVESTETEVFGYKIIRQNDGEIRDISSRSFYNPKTNKIHGVVQDVTERKMLEDSIKEERDKYLSIYNYAIDGVVLITQEGQTLAANPAACSLLGYSESELKKGGRSLVMVDDGIAFKAFYEERATKGYARAELNVRQKNGNIILLEVSSALFHNRSGQVLGTLVFHDLSERQKSQAILKESENRFRVLTENALTGVFITQDRKILYTNKAVSDIFLYTPEELLGQSPVILVHPDDQKMVADNLESRTKDEIQSSHYEYKGVRKNGEVIWIDVLVSRTFLNNEPIIIGNLIDITKRREEQAKLIRLNQLYEVISRINHLMVREQNKQTLFEEVCRIAIDSGGFKFAWIGILNETQEILEMVANTAVDVDYLQLISNIEINDPVKGNGPTATAIKEKRNIVTSDFQNDDRMAFWKSNTFLTGFNSSIALPLISRGRVIGCLTVYSGEINYFNEDVVSLLTNVANDIGYALESIDAELARKIAIKELIQTQSLLQKAQKIARLATWQYDAHGNYSYSEDLSEVFGISGYNNQDATINFEKFIHPNDQAVLSDWLTQSINGSTKSDANFRILPPDGSVKYIIAHCERINQDQGGNPTIYGIFQDITEQRKNQIELSQTETKYRELFDNAVEAIIVLQAGEITLCNLMTERITGIELSLLQGMNFLELIQADDQEDAKAVQQKISNGELSNSRNVFRLILENKKVKWVEINAIGIEWNGEPATLNFMNDITERKKAEQELQLLNMQLSNLAAHVQNVAETERTGIAREIHDVLGQQMTALKFEISRLNKRFAPEEIDVKEKLNVMSKMVDESINSIRRISAELRPGILDDFGLKAAAEWYIKEFEKNTGVKCYMHSNMEEINIDKTISISFYRILQEALTNVARHAQASKVRINLNTTDTYVKLEVADNGIGILKSHKEDLHSWGLIGMQERAKMIRGKVLIKGKKGKGTTVLLTAPLNGPAKVNIK